MCYILVEAGDLVFTWMEQSMFIHDHMRTGELEKPHNINSFINTSLLQTRPLIHVLYYS